MWERSFVAIRVLLGDSVEDALASLPREKQEQVAQIASELRSTQRSVRARALTTAAQEVALAVREAELR